MNEKKSVFGSVVVLVVVAVLCGFDVFVSAAEDIVMETYTVPCKSHLGDIVYKGKSALGGFGYMGLQRKDRKQKGIATHTFFPEKAEDKGDYKEINFSKTWEEAGFTYETNTKLYPKRIVHTISYKFTKEWEGSIYTNPTIAASLALGAKYKATDIDGLESEGMVQASVKRYVQIPKGYSIKELILYPVEGGMIKFKLESEHPSQTPNNLRLGLLGEDGKFKPKNDVRLCLIQQPPDYIFPAGYSNKIKLEIEVE